MKHMAPGLKEIRHQRGLARKIAFELGISAAAVSFWRQIPAERVLSVEKITGIRRERLRPDLYPQEN